LGGGPAHDFVVTTPGGEEVWHWMYAKISNAALYSKTLEPGEELLLTGEWEQVDNLESLSLLVSILCVVS
jgi:hypothetical protein